MSTDTMPAVPMPPGGPIEIAFSFDTTGSMSGCLPQVRAQLAHVIERLNADIPGLRIAVFAHGDYCDLASYGYVTKYIDFTNNAVELCKFVQEVTSTGGGDFEECYELVLRQVREELSWQPGTQKALVMIGDATPHSVKDKQNKDKIDWRVESKRLATETGVRIYAVQCLNNARSNDFYSHLAKSTGGKHLKLDQLTNIVEMMMAVCYRERGMEFVEAFEQEVRMGNAGGMRADLERMFGTLKDKPESAPKIKKGAAKVKKLFATPPSTPGSSKSKTSSTGSRARSDSVSSLGSSVSSDSKDSRKRKRSNATLLTRSRAHPMTTRKTKTLDDNPRRNKRNTKSITKRCAERVLRERTARKDLLLANLRWSHWREAMAHKTPRSNKEEWEDRDPGFKRTSIFGDLSDSAVYEVAVQTPNCNQKVAVMASVTKGFHNRSWEKGILALPHIKRQVDQVLKKKCKLYIRRARFTKDDLPGLYERSGVKGKLAVTDSTTPGDTVKALRGLMTRSCDYAWRMHYNPESKKYTHRSLVKKGVVISE